MQLARQAWLVWLGPRPRVPKAEGPAPVFERRGVASGSRSSSRVISVEESVSVRATSLSEARPPEPVRPSQPSRRPPEPSGPPPQQSQQFLKSEDLPGVRVWRVGGDFVGTGGKCASC